MWDEIPRIKFENGEITFDVFERGKSEPIIHIKGNLKDKTIRRRIALAKKELGWAVFSDVIDFIDISMSNDELIKELKEISREEDD